MSEIVNPVKELEPTKTLLYTLSCSPSEQISGYKYKMQIINTISIAQYKELYLMVYSEEGDSRFKSIRINIKDAKESYNDSSAGANIMCDTGNLGVEAFNARIGFARNTDKMQQIGIATVNSSSPSTTYTAKLYGIK